MANMGARKGNVGLYVPSPQQVAVLGLLDAPTVGRWCVARAALGFGAPGGPSALWGDPESPGGYAGRGPGPKVHPFRNRKGYPTT